MGDFFLHRFGLNPDVAGLEDIWDVGGEYPFPDVAFETQVVGLANDIPSSDGVHSVSVSGLDINGAEITEVATLNGATPVTLANSYYRITDAMIGVVGASGVNSGNIDVSHTGSATLARISPLEGETLMAVYTMPAGVRGMIRDWRMSIARQAKSDDVAASVRLQTRADGHGWRTRDAAEIGNTVIVDHEYLEGTGIPVQPLTDIRLRITAVSTDEVEASGGFQIKGFRDIR